MKKVFPIVSIFFLLACTESSREEKTELISSTTWTTEQVPDDVKSEFQSTFEFRSDGTYLLNAGEIEVNGKWSWVADDELYLELKGLTFNGEATKFDHKTNNYYIRIIELNETVFKTIERHESDDWNSGFAKEITYIPYEL